MIEATLTIRRIVRQVVRRVRCPKEDHSDDDDDDIQYETMQEDTVEEVVVTTNSSTPSKTTTTPTSWWDRYGLDDFAAVPSKRALKKNYRARNRFAGSAVCIETVRTGSAQIGNGSAQIGNGGAQIGDNNT